VTAGVRSKLHAVAHNRAVAPNRLGKEAMTMAKAVKKKRVVAEHALFKTHSGHTKHLCQLVSQRKMDQVADLSKAAKYLCHICGRAAAKATNLCEPVEI